MGAGMLMHSNLSHCAADYAASIGDPFTGPEKACIPDFPALQTGKNRVWQRGVWTTSSNALAAGFGYICMTPEWAAGNDLGFVYTNTAADASTIINAGTAVSYTSNSPYVSTAYSLVGVQYRVVSAGLRIRYTGPELYRGGRLIGLHHPTHSTLEGSQYATLAAYKESAQMSVERDRWTTLLYRPVEKQDIDFHTSFNAVTAGNQAAYMAFICVAPDTSGANPVAFEWEAFVNFEFLGSAVTNKTPSHVDTVGHGAVNAVTNMAKTIFGPHQQQSSSIASSLVHAASEYLFSNVSKPSAPPHPSDYPSGSAPSKSEPLWRELLDIGEEALPYLAKAAPYVAEFAGFL